MTGLWATAVAAVVVVAAATATAEPSDPTAGPILVTGATGRTGRLIYVGLKQRGVAARALVESVDVARAVLRCDACDAAEGIFVGDVTKPDTLVAATAGASAIACAIGANSSKVQESVDFLGVVNQLVALANRSSSTEQNLAFVLVSSMGTTQRFPPPFEGGSDLFWKLNAEAFLLSAGVPSVVVKPCGLVDGPAGEAKLRVGHNDKLLKEGIPTPIARADVAAVVVEAVLQVLGGAIRTALRFDLCGSKERPATSPTEVLDAARWPWQK